MAKSTDPQGFIARATAAVRYAFSGAMPDGWFGPGTPMVPQAPAEVRGRQFDYPVALNLNFQPRAREKYGFPAIKAIAETLDPLRMVIEHQKDLMVDLEWTIKTRAKSDDDGASDPQVQEITDFLQTPDREHDWAQWLRGLLDQQIVIDAVSIYARPTLGGDLYALELIDGATITPLLDQGGRRPLAPEPAFQQVLKGLPAVDYTADELTYFVGNYRPDRVYGYSRVEQVIDLAEIFLARLRSQKAVFTHGNLGDGFFTMPEGWTPEQIATWEMRWNAIMAGNVQGQRQSLFAPHGTEYHETKINLFEAEFDEWLMRLVCFVFGTPPTPFIKQVGIGNSNAQTDRETAEEGGIKPLMTYVRRLVNHLLAVRFQRPDLEFAWVEDREFDPELAQKINSERLKEGSLSINEIRDRNGEAPIDGGDKYYVFATSGPIAVEDLETIADQNAEPPPPPVLPGALGPDGKPVAPEPGAKPAVGEKPNTQGKAPAEELAKAASTTARLAVRRVMLKYLSAKAREIADAVGDKVALEKADTPDTADIDAMLDGPEWDWSDLVPQIEPLIGSVAVAAGKDAIKELSLFSDEIMDSLSLHAAQFAADRAAELVGMKWIGGNLVENPNRAWSISDTTRAVVRGLVTAALEEGKSNSELRRDILSSTTFDKDRADNIARTETAIADKRGSVMGWRESGAVGGREWVTAPDCCDECDEYDGMIIGIDDEWPFGDLPHPSCRCTEVGVLPEDMPAADDDAGDD